MTMMPFSTAALATGLDGIALLGCVQAIAGAVAMERFNARVRRTRMIADAGGELPSITVLKPLHGDEPMLELALLGFVTQDYPAMQIIFGVQSASDPAIGWVRSLQRRYPDRDLRLVIDATPHGPNRKVGNLINMLPHASHDLLVISDSDIHVAPDYLRRIAACFIANPQAGLVTTLYHGIPASPSFSRRLAAGHINHSFMPGVLLSRLLGRQDCLGSTMALHRSTLEAIGGLAMLSPHVADDSVLGTLIRAQGRSIEIAPSLTATTIAETSASDLFSHELRWGRTVRAVEPLGYALSAVQFPLFWASLALAAAPLALWSWCGFSLVWVLRAMAAAQIDRLIRLTDGSSASNGLRRTMPFLLLPLRDWVSAIIMAASFSGRRVNWRGQMLDVGRRPSRPPAPILTHAHRTLAQGD